MIPDSSALHLLFPDGSRRDQFRQLSNVQQLRVLAVMKALAAPLDPRKEWSRLWHMRWAELREQVRRDNDLNNPLNNPDGSATAALEVRLLE